MLQDLLRRGASNGEICAALHKKESYVHHAIRLLRKELCLDATATRGHLILACHGRSPDHVGPASARFGEMMNRLTPREKEVALRVVRGEPDHEIARLLGIGRTTVKAHIENIIAGLEIADRYALIVIYCGSEPYFKPAHSIPMVGSRPIEVQPTYVNHMRGAARV